ncbi:hypothetical protein GGF46_002337 [Coemansia sp. RSA 552]|nr:hypothetical protein GGF46_002337 [Coemansia sp. RSA 552]
MLRWICIGVLSALLLTWFELHPHPHTSTLVRRQQSSNDTPKQTTPPTTTDIPDYVQVSPDYVALAPSAPEGLDADTINNMACLVNRFRYDSGAPPVALDASLVRHAQARAELLAKKKTPVQGNHAGDGFQALSFNQDIWVDVQENMVYSANSPTMAYWDLQKNKAAAATLVNQKFLYFGTGYSNGYYVQAFGAPVNGTAITDTELFSHCPANETFYSWVFPNKVADPPVDTGTHLVGHEFPYKFFEQTAKRKWAPYNPGDYTGMVDEPKFYFSSPNGTVPYLQSLAILDTVASEESSTPFSAIAQAGEMGATPSEINQMVCLINARRYESCLPPLALHNKLVSAAQAHSYDMNRAQNLSHYSAAGNLGTRVKRRGFAFSTLAENIARGQPDPYTAHVGFCESAGHLGNILRPQFSDTDPDLGDPPSDSETSSSESEDTGSIVGWSESALPSQTLSDTDALVDPEPSNANVVTVTQLVIITVFVNGDAPQQQQPDKPKCKSIESVAAYSQTELDDDLEIILEPDLDMN